MDNRLWALLNRIRTVLDEGSRVAKDIENSPESDPKILGSRQRELENLRSEYVELVNEASQIDKAQTESYVKNIRTWKERIDESKIRREEVYSKILNKPSDTVLGSSNQSYLDTNSALTAIQRGFKYGKQTSFKSNLKKGKIWEGRIIKFLKKLPETINVTDVSNDPGYQKMDVDLLWKHRREDTGTTIHAIDVKTNWSSTERVYLETIANIHSKAPGKFFSSTADYFFYVYPSENSLLTINLLWVQEWYKKNKDKYRKYISSHNRNDGTISQVNEYVSIPRKHLLGVRGVNLIPNFYQKTSLESVSDKLRKIFGN